MIVTVGSNLQRRISDTADQVIKVYTDAQTEEGKVIIVWVERLFPIS